MRIYTRNAKEIGKKNEDLSHKDEAVQKSHKVDVTPKLVRNFKQKSSKIGQDLQHKNENNKDQKQSGETKKALYQDNYS